MPSNEQEFHPYLKIGESIKASRMIVGTFPVYSVTRPYSLTKELKRNGSSLFFYGSSQNNMWSYYKKYVDPTIIIGNNKSILMSLKANKIAISDVISGCFRKEYSPKDSDLKFQSWNTNLACLIYNEIDKIICTSKGQVSAMGWLIKNILLPGGFIIDNTASATVHNGILTNITSCNLNVSNIGFVLSKGNKKVSIVSIPSPAGSGTRSLKHFGYLKHIHNSSTFLNEYLTSVFNWF